jgi:Calcineurin-like phosphoesterase
MRRMHHPRRWIVAAGLAASLLAGGCHHDDDGVIDATVPGDRDMSTPTDKEDLSPGIELGTAGGHIDPDGGGGEVSLLSFGAFGDVRPPIPDDDFQYPTTVVTTIMKQIATIKPQFVVATGDYMYVEFIAASANDQIALLKNAETNVDAPIFHAMGNHECNSFSDVNCPNLNESVNITAFLSQLVAFTPTPWYSFTIHTALGDAKFLFIAVNAWNPAQAAWLTAALNVSTRYTFIIRHQPTPDAGDDSSAAGVAASDAIIAGHPITLFLYGHVHEYNHLTVNAVITGNAGAPLDAGAYGWLHVLQRSDGNIAVNAVQMSSGMVMDSWAVTPEGLAAP